MEFVIGGSVLLTLGLYWLIPIFLILKSDRTSGGTKLLWLLIVMFVCWFAWIAYLLLVPKRPLHRS